MTATVTVFAPGKLAKGFSEAELLEASDFFQKEFVSKQKGVIRREFDRH